MIQQDQHGESSVNFRGTELNRILTSHVGSLPRSQEVVDFIFARENNKKYNEKDFDKCMQQNVQSTVQKQKNAGIDIVSDGEPPKSLMQLMSKIDIQAFLVIALEMLQRT